MIGSSIVILVAVANLLANGGFEQGKDSPSCWHVSTPGDVNKKVEWGKNIVFDAKTSPNGRCVKFLMNEPSTEFGSIAANEGFGFGSDLIPVQFGKKYRVSVDLRVRGKRKKDLPYSFVFIKGFRDDPVKGKLMVFQAQMDCEMKTPDEWKRFELEFPIPKESIKEIMVLLYSCYPAGIAWFDNVSLEETGDK